MRSQICKTERAQKYILTQCVCCRVGCSNGMKTKQRQNFFYFRLITFSISLLYILREINLAFFFFKLLLICFGGSMAIKIQV